MPIIEVANTDAFVEWMRDKDPNRFKLIFTEDGEAIYTPTVTTSRVETLFIRGLSQAEQEKIGKKAQEELKVNKVWKCKHYFFDERKEPRERREE
jgi:uncharacterized short protein YbdD (DUF466 family)